jgi:hypothetical protein
MSLPRSIVGAAAGAAAIFPMTAWMLIGQASTRHGEQPPKRILRKVAHRAQIPASRFGPTTLLATAAAHVGVGAGCGALYAAAVRRSTPLRGMMFGTAVWAVSYAGFLPALKLMPPPHRDKPGRVATILTAHLVYGAALHAALTAGTPTQPQSPAGTEEENQSTSSSETMNRGNASADQQRVAIRS